MIADFHNSHLNNRFFDFELIITFDTDEFINFGLDFSNLRDETERDTENVFFLETRSPIFMTRTSVTTFLILK